MYRRLLIPLSLLIFMASASSATAATRYASPTGTPSMLCIELTPCDLGTAIDGASGSDEVVLKFGTYNLTPASNSVLPGDSAPAGLVIRGERAVTTPLIVSTPSAASVNGFRLNDGVELRDVRIMYQGVNADAYALNIGRGSKLDRVRVLTTNPSTVACGIWWDTVVKNTTCLANGNNGVAMQFWIGTNVNVSDWSIDASVRNSTFVAAGDNANALQVTSTNSGSKVFTINLTAVNSIFFAPGTGSADVLLTANQAGTTVTNLVSTNSNYSTPTLSGAGSKTFTPLGTSGNQSAEPLLTDIWLGRLTELPGSPTIDAGIDDAENGTLDAAGQSRTHGAHTDIGAFEWQPPTEPSTPTTPSTYSVNKLSFSPKNFRATGRGATFQPSSKKPKARRGKKPVGTLLGFTTSEPGALRAYLFRAESGRRGKGGKCQKVSRSNAKAKRCSRYSKLRGNVALTTTKASDAVYFNGRWNKKKLSSGKYVLVLQHTGGHPAAPASTSTTAAASRTAKFSIVR